MNILWTSGYSAQSGYANMARLIVPRLQQLGHEVTVFELGSRINRPTMVGTVRVVPPAQDPFGTDILESHAQNFGADAVITLLDVWGFNGDVYGRVPWYPWTPIDHLPPQPGVTAVLRKARKAIAMSTYGYDQIQRTGLEAYYVPLCYDPELFSPGDKRAARAKLGIPKDAYFVAFVGVNDSVPSRKGIPELLAAWGVASEGKTDWLLYMHTAETGNITTNPHFGVNIPNIMKTFNVDPKTVLLPDQYEYRTGMPQSILTDYYRAADLLILPSRGEGFGLPLIEAQACGCPVATTECASQQELCASGYFIEGEVEWTWQNATVQKPGILSIAEVLQRAYEERGDPKLVRGALEMARQYEVGRVVQTYWRPVLADIAVRRLDELCASVS